MCRRVVRGRDVVLMLGLGVSRVRVSSRIISAVLKFSGALRDRVVRYDAPFVGVVGSERETGFLMWSGMGMLKS